MACYVNVIINAYITKFMIWLQFFISIFSWPTTHPCKKKRKNQIFPFGPFWKNCGHDSWVHARARRDDVTGGQTIPYTGSFVDFLPVTSALQADHARLFEHAFTVWYVEVKFKYSFQNVRYWMVLHGNLFCNIYLISIAKYSFVHSFSELATKPKLAL